jgi:hypothetical protein
MSCASSDAFMTAAAFVSIMTQLGCGYDAIHLVDTDGTGATVRRLNRIVNGNTLWAAFDVEDPKVILDTQIISIYTRLRFTAAERATAGLP